MAAVPCSSVLFSLRVPVRTPCGYRQFYAHLARRYPQLAKPYLVLMATAAAEAWKYLRRHPKMWRVELTSPAGAETNYYTTPLAVTMAVVVLNRMVPSPQRHYALLRHRAADRGVRLFQLLVLRRARDLQVVLLYVPRDGEGPPEERLVRFLAPDLAEQPWAVRPAEWRRWFLLTGLGRCHLPRSRQVVACYALGLVSSRAYRFFHFLRLRQAGLPVSLVSVFTALEAQGLLCYPVSFCPGPRMPLLVYRLARYCAGYRLHRSLVLLATPRGVFCTAADTPPAGLCRFDPHRPFGARLIESYGHHPEILVEDILHHYLVPAARLVEAAPALPLEPRPWEVEEVLEHEHVYSRMASPD